MSVCVCLCPVRRCYPWGQCLQYSSGAHFCCPVSALPPPHYPVSRLPVPALPDRRFTGSLTGRTKCHCGNQQTSPSDGLVSLLWVKLHRTTESRPVSTIYKNWLQISSILCWWQISVPFPCVLQTLLHFHFALTEGVNTEANMAEQAWICSLNIWFTKSSDAARARLFTVVGKIWTWCVV